MRYAWIDTHRNGYGVDEMSAVLDVSESGYWSWKHAGKPCGKRLSDGQMLQAIHVEFKGAYGSPRMVRELRLRGFPASRKRVERLMQENDIRAKHKRHFKVTMDSKHNLPIAPNLLSQPQGQLLGVRSLPFMVQCPERKFGSFKNERV